MNYPKQPRERNPHLLRMAQDEVCLMQIPNVCSGNSDTVIAAHSNSSAHGKGKATKAHDWASVWCCAACHLWLDIGVSPRVEKEAAFKAAHERQKHAWADIANDDKQRARDRSAARWALERAI